jgi:hypothetical protein
MKSEEFAKQRAMTTRSAREAAEKWLAMAFMRKFSGPFDPADTTTDVFEDLARIAADFAERLAMAERHAHSYINGDQWVHSRRWVNDAPLRWAEAMKEGGK